jgi:hypothetical protein
MRDFFDNDDDLNGEDEFFNFINNQHKDRLRFHKNMFVNDVERFVYQRIPLEPIECDEIFEGTLNNEDRDILTQLLIKDYIRWWDTEPDLVFEKWGLSWVDYLMEYNVTKEEYEICSFFKEIFDSGKIYFKKYRNETSR